MTADCLIIGGGVSGLWLLSRLRDAGANAWLLEKSGLGSGQTLASQGIIHGGVKYSLSGKITGSTKAIASMPSRWHQHMQDQQLPLLKGLKILSSDQYLLTRAGMTGRLLRSLAYKTLSSDASYADLESLRLTAPMTGLLIQEDIIDTRSLISLLQEKMAHFCRQHLVAKEDIERGSDGWSIRIGNNLIKPRLLIFAAGEGNSDFVGSNKVQLRPLHMVCVYHPDLFPVYAHILEASNKKPLLTLSSHYDSHGRLVWYIGGDMAETGAGLYGGQQSLRVEQYLRQLWTTIDWGHAKWSCFQINRAERRNTKLLRPEWPEILSVSKNAMAVFPTKMTFAPLLSDMVLEKYNQLARLPEHGYQPNNILEALPIAQLGDYPWDTL